LSDELCEGVLKTLVRCCVLFEAETEIFDAGDESLESVDEFFASQVDWSRNILDFTGRVVVFSRYYRGNAVSFLIVDAVYRRLGCRMLVCGRAGEGSVDRAFLRPPSCPNDHLPAAIPPGMTPRPQPRSWHPKAPSHLLKGVTDPGTPGCHLLT
jgi:hypothetical protein